MSKVDRFWSHEAQNIRCVRESDYDALSAELATLKAGHGEAVAIVCGSQVQWLPTAEHVPDRSPLYTDPPATGVIVSRELLEWAVERWHLEVSQRPLVNVHRRSLDDTWRQVIRKLGGDPIDLCGPGHDALLAQSQEVKP